MYQVGVYSVMILENENINEYYGKYYILHVFIVFTFGKFMWSFGRSVDSNGAIQSRAQQELKVGIMVGFDLRLFLRRMG